MVLWAFKLIMVVVSRNYFPLLDWVRFLAALLVVLGHARPAHWVGWSDLSIDSHRLAAQFFFLLISPGRQAVVVFFVLSGFLVGGRLIQRIRAGTFSLPSYALDRATRILIPLIPSLGVTVISVFLVHRGFPPGFWGQLTCNLGQLQGIACPPLEGNSSLWSLNYEVWFYVVGGLLGTFFLSCRINQFKAWIVWLQGSFLFVGLWALSMLESVYLFAWVIGAIAAIRPFAILGSKSLLVNICWLLLGVGVSQFGGY